MADSGGQDTTPDLFADAALYEAELGQADVPGIYPNSGLAVCNVLFGLVGFPPVMLAFEARESGLLPFLDTAEEVLVGKVEVTQSLLKRYAVNLFQPN